MIKRYTLPKIGRVWTDRTKFNTWLKVELAVIKARCNLGIYDPKIINLIRPQARFRIRDIIKLDQQIEHDLEAFVEIVRQSLPHKLRRFIHDGLTSYDTEVPALALQFRQAGKILIEDLQELIDALRLRASEHMWTYCMGITHGQDAEPTTFGWRLCGYLDLIEQGKKNLLQALEQIKMVKCSGAVGNWMTISPQEEQEVYRILGLRVRPAATQIVARDVFANFLSQLAIIGGGIEKIATDLRLLATSAYGEIQEPRKKKQKGSSAMPHKKNPILLERMCGMAIMLRGYAAMGQELIRTWLERDIAHSCVERIAFPDATIILDYMLQKMTRIISGMIINRKQMVRNINRSRGCWASEKVKLLLCNKGFDTEKVYSFVQACAFKAFEQRRPFRAVLLKTSFPGKRKTLGELISRQEINACFDFKTSLKRNLPQAYKRMGLNPDKALPPNTK